MSCPRCGSNNSYAVPTHQPANLKADRRYSRRLCRNCSRMFMTLKFVLPDLVTHGGKPGRVSKILNSYTLTKEKP